MPKIAFQNLWDTINKGNVWSGYVKNTTKDGGHYWVYSTVYPIQDPQSNKKTFLSCRRKPSPQEIQDAQSLYKTLR